MSRQITNAFGRSLSIASVALLIQIGSAAAAPHNDFQRQVSAVLAGTRAMHSALPADSARNGAAGAKADAQQFVQQLLLGWSASHPARAGSATQSRSSSASDVSQQDSSAETDIQSTVQRFLRGE